MDGRPDTRFPAKATAIVDSAVWDKTERSAGYRSHYSFRLMVYRLHIYGRTGIFLARNFTVYLPLATSPTSISSVDARSVSNDAMPQYRQQSIVLCLVRKNLLYGTEQAL